MGDDHLDNLRKLAEAGVKVLGPDEQLLESREYHCDYGTWGFVGAVGAVALMALTNIGPWWTLAIAFTAGFVANYWERRKILWRIRKSEQHNRSINRF
jgi:hypothetical protein